MTNTLNHPENLYETLKTSSTFAVVLLDEQSQVVSWNEGASHLFGYQAQETIKKNINFLKFHRYPEISLVNHIQNTITKKGKWEGSIFSICKNNQSKFIHLFMTLLPSEKKSAKFFLLGYELPSEQQNAMTSTPPVPLDCPGIVVDRSLEKLTHELRTPLNAIISFTGMLLMRLPGPLTEAQEKQLNMVSDSANELLKIINLFLEKEKIVSHKEDLLIEKISFKSLIEEIKPELDLLANLKQISLDFVELSEDVLFCSDKKIIKKILQELISNAIQFTEQGKVKVYLEQLTVENKHQLIFHVIDSGKGMSTALQKDLLAKLDRAISFPYEQDTGMGLYFANHLIYLLDGKLEFQSVENKGSHFKVFLPLS